MNFDKANELLLETLNEYMAKFNEKFSFSFLEQMSMCVAFAEIADENRQQLKNDISAVLEKELCEIETRYEVEQCIERLTDIDNSMN